MTFISDLRTAFLRRGAPTERVPWRKAKWFYIFISPWMIGFLIFTLGPILVGIIMSFSNFNGMNFNSLQYVGTQNYVDAFQDERAWEGFKLCLYFAALSIPLGLITSFFMAVLLTRSVRAQGIFRTLYYIPSIIPVVASAWIWKLMWDNNFGMVNAGLDAIIPGTYVRWMTQLPIYVLIMLGLWRAGGGSIIFMAGLQGVPKELDEAAIMDGANSIQRFRYVTLPMLTPVIFYQLIMAILGVGQILIEPMLIFGQSREGGGGLNQSVPNNVYFFMVYIFNRVFTNLRFGYGFALLWLLFIFVIFLTLVVFSTARYWVHYEVSQD